MEDLKQKYAYITDEQWDLVSLGEAEYLDFLTEEDLQIIQDESLENEEKAREAQIQAIIDQLKSTEQTDEAKLIVGGAMALQQFFFSQAGRYIGQNLMHQFIQYQPFRGLRIYTMSYETPEGGHGYNLQFMFTHSSGLRFEKTVPGEGSNKESSDWSLVVNPK